MRKKGFYGGYIKNCRRLANFFTPRAKYKAELTDYGEPVVYVCRHLNLHGPLTVVRSFKKDVHVMVLNVFFTEKDAKNHYYNVTFKNNRNKKLLAFVAGGMVPKMVNSGKFIPVYRGDDSRLFSTVKKSFDCLSSGEDIAVFPDKNYKAKYGEPSDIYPGFLTLEKLYFKKYGKHLKFVPLVIDDKNRKIIEKPPVLFSDEVDFKTELEIVKQRLITAINDI